MFANGWTSPFTFRLGGLTKVDLRKLQRKTIGLHGVHHVAIDVGTYKVSAKYEDRIVSIPCMVAVEHNERGAVIARHLGNEALRMYEVGNRKIKVIEPMKDGLMRDVDCIEELILRVAHEVTEIPYKKGGRRLGEQIKLHVTTGIPPKSKMDRREVRALEGIMKAVLNPMEVYVVTQTMAAAKGSGLPVEEPEGCCIIDIGGGTSDIGLISTRGEVRAFSIDFGGKKMDRAIRDHIKKTQGVDIGTFHSEQAKRESGSAFPENNGRSREPYKAVGNRIKGKSELVEITISCDEIGRALDKPMLNLIDEARKVLGEVPHRSAARIKKDGITMSGGGSLLAFIAERVSQGLDIRCTVADHAEESVVRGLHLLGQNDELIRSVMLASSNEEFS